MGNTTVKFTKYLFTPWLIGSIQISLKDIKICIPNTTLGIFPLGNKMHLIPLRNISCVSLNTSYKLKIIVTGLVELLLAFILKFGFGGILAELAVAFLVFSGIYSILSGFQTSLCIQRSGNDLYFRIPINYRGKIRKAVDEINKALDYEADKTDLNIHTGSLANEIAGAMAQQLSPELLRRQSEEIQENKPENTTDLQMHNDEETRALTDRFGWINALQPFLLVLITYYAIVFGVNNLTARLGLEVLKMRQNYDEVYSNEESGNSGEVQKELVEDLNDWEYFYFPILQEYKDAVQKELEEKDRNYVNDVLMTKLEFSSLLSEPMKVYAGLVDIDYNDIPELIISVRGNGDSDSEEYLIIDMYTFANGQGKSLFNDPEMGFQNKYDLCENGMIRCLVSDSEHPLNDQPIEIQYFKLNEGNIIEVENVSVNEEGFGGAADKYSLYTIENWNDLSEWSNPLKNN